VLPLRDRSAMHTAGLWFHKERRRANTVFLIICLALIILTVVGTFLRGPYWDFYWPWEAWPPQPPKI
jgi:cytochrome b-561